MNAHVSNTRWSVGIALLGAVLLFGFYGIVSNAKAGEQALFEQDAVYIEECGACHLAYPPGLLPAGSWRAMMQGLDDHFGENAELDEETTAHVAGYLERLSLQKGEPSTMSKMLRNLPDEPLLRITELPAFVQAHDEIPKQLEVEKLADGFLSPCADCHREAADGIFDKDRLHPGYGPKTWGGDNPP